MCRGANEQSSLINLKLHFYRNLSSALFAGEFLEHLFLVCCQAERYFFWSLQKGPFENLVELIFQEGF